jgi:hypothetical protein
MWLLSLYLYVTIILFDSECSFNFTGHNLGSSITGILVCLFFLLYNFADVVISIQLCLMYVYHILLSWQCSMQLFPTCLWTEILCVVSITQDRVINNPWRYSSWRTLAEQPPLAVFPDCTRRYWVDMWSAHRIPQLHFQLSKPEDRVIFYQNYPSWSMRLVYDTEYLVLSKLKISNFTGAYLLNEK